MAKLKSAANDLPLARLHNRCRRCAPISPQSLSIRTLAQAQRCYTSCLGRTHRSGRRTSHCKMCARLVEVCRQRHAVAAPIMGAATHSMRAAQCAMQLCLWLCCHATRYHCSLRGTPTLSWTASKAASCHTLRHLVPAPSGQAPPSSQTWQALAPRSTEHRRERAALDLGTC